MKDNVSRMLSGRRAAFGAFALAAVVVAAACSSATPGAPSLAADVASTAATAPSVPGNCSIPGAEKDESSPFFIEGATAVWIKAGNNCIGGETGITVSGDYNNCFRVTFDATGVTVVGLGGRDCRGLGVSHIEALVTPPPPPPPPPPCDPKEDPKCEEIPK